MLIPLGDVCVELIAQHQEEIRRHTRLFMPEYDRFMVAHDKILANKAAQAAGVPIPRCWYPDEAGLDAVLKSADFPVLVKPAMDVGARGIIRADSPGQLQRAWSMHRHSAGRKFVQELIPLTGRQYVLDLLMDTQFRLVAAVASQKVRFFPVKAGAGTLSRSINRPDLCQAAAGLLRSIGY
ncbi:unnamed protein product, partial [marine sediment metagenome]